MNIITEDDKMNGTKTMSVKKININQSESTYDIASDVGYFYVGVATPTTDPGTPDGKVVYFANTAGTYQHFDNITVEENKVIALYNVNGSWESHEIANINITTENIIDRAVTYDKLQNEIKEVAEGVTYIENPEFLSVKTDSEGKLLWWIEKDGSVNWVKGIPQPIQIKLQELEQKIKDNSYDDKPLSKRVTANEADIVAINEALNNYKDSLDNYKVEVTKTLDKKVDGEYIDNQEFVQALLDKDGKLLEYTDNRGNKTFGGEISSPTLDKLQSLIPSDEKIEALGSKSIWYDKTIWWCGTSIPAAGYWDVNNTNSYPYLTGLFLGAKKVWNEAVGSSSANGSKSKSSYEV